MVDGIKSILVEKHKLIFTVLSKNACTSMKAHLLKILGLSQSIIFPLDVHGPRVYDYPLVADMELVSSYSSYLRFCIIRNPWSRLVSCYKNKIKENPNDNYLIKNGVSIRFAKLSDRFQKGMSFADFVEVICEIPDSKADTHFRSQLYDMITMTGDLRVNYIAKLENLNMHLEDISELSGMGFSEFPRLNNTSKKQDYTEYYTPDLIEKVRKRYMGDITLFNYEFGKGNVLDLGLLNEMKEKEITTSNYFAEVVNEKEEAKKIFVNETSSKPSQKIFCIGLNKTGTRSVSTALNKLKRRTAHYDSEIGRISEVFEANLSRNLKMLSGLENYVAFSDWINMEGTNNEHFKILDKQYPGSKFIYTDRNLESWIKSRLKHVDKIDRLNEYQKIYPESKWYSKNIEEWTVEYHKHKQDVLDYFKDRESDLLQFNIFEGDSWDKLCSFLKTPMPNQSFPVKGKSSFTKEFFIKLYFVKGNIYVRQHKLIFYFIPGSANLAIKASLISYVGRKVKFEHPQNIHLVDDFPFPTFKKSFSHPSVDKQFRFTLVKNPWDRLVGTYREMICSPDLPDRFFKFGAEESFNEYDNLFQRNMKFDDFVRAVCSIPEAKTNRYFCSQIYQLTSSTGKLKVNYIGYYENLKKAAIDVYEHSQISLHEVPLTLAKVNDTSYTEMYTDELKDLVGEKFAADIFLFGYTYAAPLESQVVDFVSDQFLTKFTESKYYIDVLKEKNKNLEHNFTKANRQVNVFKEGLSRKELELQTLKSSKRELINRKEIEEFKRSLSWRITAPMRKVASVLNKLLK